MNTTSGYAIHWFRRDLRVRGNPALFESHRTFKGRVIGIFCFDETFLSREDFSQNRFGFFLKTLEALREELKEKGGELRVFNRPPQDVFEQIFTNFKAQRIPLPQQVSWNRDYEPFARERDARIEKLLTQTYSISVRTERDHLMIEPHELLKQDGSFYQVFTPFKNKWLSVAKTASIKERFIEKPNLSRFELTWDSLIKSKHVSDLVRRDSFDDMLGKVLPQVSVPLPEAGAERARKKLNLFITSRFQNYSKDRDYPAQAGTSQLSIYFKNGSLAPAHAVKCLPHSYLKESTYLNELIWREFYYHILWHRPDVERQAFLRKYVNLPWLNPKHDKTAKSMFEAWKDGKTGFPLVDAGMRQLLETGWMHNRVRMVVASFLTKDLLIDWRAGENYFMKTLLDGDLAPNNGGWQWAASTGCDPQPYFRIFNPALQSQKFDPEAEYIKTWVPELRSLSPKNIHSPDGILNHPTYLTGSVYPKPIVQHAAQKLRVLKLFSQA